ncbi:hypothetical protein [Amycolatopsis japonica]
MRLGEKMGSNAGKWLVEMARERGVDLARARMIWTTKPNGHIWGYPPSRCSRAEAALRVRRWTEFVDCTVVPPEDLQPGMPESPWRGVVDGHTILVGDTPYDLLSGPARAISSKSPKPALGFLLKLPGHETGYGRISGRLDPEDL